MVDLIVFDDAQALAKGVAMEFAQLADDIVAARGHFSVALSGGKTPESLYRQLARAPFRSQIPWDRIHFFWGDERCVPPDQPGSNYRMARESLLDHIDLPSDNIHRIVGELDPRTAVTEYTEALISFYRERWPRFDLVLLGLGLDGHTASIFPGSKLLEENNDPVGAVTTHYKDRPAQRITLTLPVFNRARRIFILVSGKSKASIVKRVLKKPDSGLPIQKIQPLDGKLTWMLDADAASQL